MYPISISFKHTPSFLYQNEIVNKSPAWPLRLNSLYIDVGLQGFILILSALNKLFILTTEKLELSEVFQSVNPSLKSEFSM